MLKSHGQDYLVGNKLSRADVSLVELLYHVEEMDPGIVDNFPLLKVLCFKPFEDSPYLTSWKAIF